MALMTEGVVKERRDKDKNPNMKHNVYRKAADQHGRLWGAEIDKRTDQPSTVLKPYFTAPWYPHDSYVKWVTDEETTTPRVVINYAEMKADRRATLKAWEKVLVRVGVQLDGEHFNPAKPSARVLMQMSQIWGEKPEPVEIVIAAERGNPWILGETDEMPNWAVPYFVRTDIDEGAFLNDDDSAVEPDETPAAEPTKKRGRRAA